MSRPVLSVVYHLTCNDWVAFCQYTLELPSITGICDELSTHKGILLKGHWIIILPLLWYFHLADIHMKHQGISKCQQMAIDTIYWHGINSDIMDYVKRCKIYIIAKCFLTSKLLLKNEVPHSPVHKVGIDFLGYSSKYWLLISDYFSMYPFFIKVI